MEPKELKENFASQLEKLDREIGQLRQALAQRQELALKLQGAVEAMNLQLGETGVMGAEPEAVAEAMATEPEAPAAD